MLRLLRALGVFPVLVWSVQAAESGSVVSSSAPIPPFESSGTAAAGNAIDGIVFQRLEELGLTPALPCSDEVFIRRAFIDVIGTLPRPEEVRQFLASRDAARRAKLVDHLLAREEFVDYWTMKWSDLLRIKAEFPVNLWPNAAQAYHRWVRTAVRDNLPYDRFARELLTASGSNFRVGPVNFYRTMPSREPEAIGASIALTLMGTRVEHWPAHRLSAMSVCFRCVAYKATAEWKEEIVYFDPSKLPPDGGATVVFPDGASVQLSRDRDPREVFADWLITPRNLWFTRAIANRVWFWLLGRGIIHEPDDIRPDNPPVIPELLALLERELIAARYDLKQLMRLILNSRTYQLSSIARSDRPDAPSVFACYPQRRLEAEVLIDGLNAICGTSEKYTSAIPEPFTFIPEEHRAIALPDGSISSSFLEMFGRPARDTGLEAERNNGITAAQRLHLLNSTHVQRKLEQGPRLQALLRARLTPPELVGSLYVAILSRFPTDEERRIAAAHLSATIDKRAAALDLAWALINSAEFLHRH